MRSLESPGPLSRTFSSRASPTRRDVTSITPPSLRAAIAWRTLFSTSGCSSRFGTRASSVSGSKSYRTREPSPKRACSISRYLARNSRSSLSGTSCALRRSSAIRSRSLSRTSIRSAASHVAVHQRGDAVQRVEQEVRVELALQRLQLRLGEPRLELRGAQRAVLRLAEVAGRVAEPDDGAVGHHLPVEVHDEVALHALPPGEPPEVPAAGHGHIHPLDERHVHEDEHEHRDEVHGRRALPDAALEGKAPGHPQHDRREQRPAVPEAEVEDREGR